MRKGILTDVSTRSPDRYYDADFDVWVLASQQNSSMAPTSDVDGSERTAFQLPQSHGSALMNDDDEEEGTGISGDPVWEGFYSGPLDAEMFGFLPQPEQIALDWMSEDVKQLHSGALSDGGWDVSHQRPVEKENLEWSDEEPEEDEVDEDEALEDIPVGLLDDRFVDDATPSRLLLSPLHQSRSLSNHVAATDSQASLKRYPSRRRNISPSKKPKVTFAQCVTSPKSGEGLFDDCESRF